MAIVALQLLSFTETSTSVRPEASWNWRCRRPSGSAHIEVLSEKLHGVTLSPQPSSSCLGTGIREPDHESLARCVDFLGDQSQTNQLGMNFPVRVSAESKVPWQYMPDAPRLRDPEVESRRVYVRRERNHATVWVY